jgi:hypothetical protein
VAHGLPRVTNVVPTGFIGFALMIGRRHANQKVIHRCVRFGGER